MNRVQSHPGGNIVTEFTPVVPEFIAVTIW